MKNIKLKYFYFIFTITVILSSCSPKIYFTPDLRTRLENNGVDLKNIQFYNDRQVLLKREISSGEAKVTQGKVIVENGKYINIVKLKPQTPGVCVKKSYNGVDISFEFGKDKSLSFGPNVTDGSKVKYYQLYANEWKDGLGKVSYDYKIYYIQSGGGQTKLMIKKSELNNLEIDKRTIKGRKL